jgi:ferredoxin
MKAKVNPDLCIGCTLCVGTCPEVFRMEQDKAMAYVNPVPEASYELCRRAAEECPVIAIEIIE